MAPSSRGQSAKADFAIFQRRIHSLRLGGTALVAALNHGQVTAGEG